MWCIWVCFHLSSINLSKSTGTVWLLIWEDALGSGNSVGASGILILLNKSNPDLLHIITLIQLEWHGNLYTCERKVEKQSLNPWEFIYLWKKGWKAGPESQGTYIPVGEGLKSSPWIPGNGRPLWLTPSCIVQVVGIPPGWDATPQQVTPTPPPQNFVRVYAICQ